MNSKNGVHTKEIDGWQVSWESAGDYRFWCKQEHVSNSDKVLVVMFNPGSLSGSGENLKKDTTLRILREIFEGTGYNPYIVNLFSLATPKPWMLFDNWSRRDHPKYSVNSLDCGEFSAIMYAYGAYEFEKDFSEDILVRIRMFKEHLSSVPEIDVPKAKTGTPMHPMRIQIEGLKDEFRTRISQAYKANN